MSSTVVASLCDSLQALWVSDPLMKALNDGPHWSEIPRILKTNDVSKTSSKCPIHRTLNASEEDDVCVTITIQTDRFDTPHISVGIKTLIVRNLPRDITVQQLRNVFDKYGPIKDIYIPKNMDKSSPYFGTTKGFALIKFLNAEDSAKAFTAEYGCLTIGRNNISIEFAKEDR